MKLLCYAPEDAVGDLALYFRPWIFGKLNLCGGSKFGWLPTDIKRGVRRCSHGGKIRLAGFL
jgi:hypothetical protein